MKKTYYGVLRLFALNY